MTVSLKKTPFFCLLLILPLLTMAQEERDEQYYADLYGKLYKNYSNDPNDVENMLLMAEFYADTLNPQRNDAAAMKLICAAEKKYIAMVEDRDQTKAVRKLIKKKITVVLVRQTKQRIIRQARAVINSDMPLSDKEVDNYAEAFRDDPFVQRSIEHRRIAQKFRQAKEENTLASYSSFMASYEATNEGEEALRLMRSLATSLVATAKSESQVDSILSGYLSIPSIQEIAFHSKSALAYDKLSKQPSAQAYRSFLAKYPGSDEYSLVLSKLENISNEEFTHLTTARQFADFALNNPDNPLADKAIETIKRMIREHRDIDAVKIYLSEFQLDVDYNNIYLEFFNWHTEEGNKAPIELFATQHPDFPFRMALHDALAAAQRYDSIDISHPFEEKDFKQWSSKIYHLTGKKQSFVALQRTLQQFIAKHEWAKALARIDFFELSFDEYCVEQVAELRALLQAPAHPSLAATPIVRPVYDFMHPVMLDDNNILYNRMVNGHNEIHCAYKTKSKRGFTWRGTGAIAFTNFVNNGIQLFNLFDNNEKMLCGYRGNILIAQHTEQGWTVTETLPAPVNSQHTDFDAFMLPDGSGILFASDRPGGHNLQPSHSYFHGDSALASDIWYAPRTDKGWGSPINLGPAINTPYMECSPIITDDLKTIYFITDASGLGFGDIYYATRDDISDWTHWSKPVNCGKEINTGHNESSVSFCNNGNSLLYCSNSAGNDGCYTAPTPHTFNSDRRQTRIYAESTGMLISIIDVSTQKTLYDKQPIEANSSWINTFYSNKSYLLFAESDNSYIPGIVFIPSSSRIIIPKAYTADTLLSMSRRGASLPMHALLFENNRPSLLSISATEIEHLADFLKKNPSLSVEIIVHIEGSDDTFCYNLSNDRGNEIKRQLTLHGIEADRIIVSPYGNSITKRGLAKTSTALLFTAKR